ncbi:MAG: SUMF1/EgtB/PvdO family nonheme iron enzyme [Candidatus Hatepunaea meridiana]|nr:SUMF1/EgtB/PvdO family nonheme iron enzyme [Candidatus Hatepunaea meridiana]
MKKHLLRSQTGMSVLLAILITFSFLQAQQLQQMEFEELKADNIIFDDASQSLLIVESTIPKLMFHSNRGIKPNAVKEEKQGLWYVYLEPGVQLVTIMADGYLDVEFGRHNYQPRRTRKILVTGEQPKGLGSFRIETTPSGAMVTFNNLPVPGLTPLTLSDQPTGTHSIRIEKDDYCSLDETVTIEKDKTVTRTFTLQKEYASLKVTSDPPGATVYLDGDQLGTTPLDRNDLSIGEGILTVEKDGYVTNSQTVRLKVGDNPPVNVYLVLQTGSVSITTIPSGTEIFLDGESLGIYNGTPLVRDKLSLGSHTVRASIDGYDDAEQIIAVTFNKISTVPLSLQGKPGALFVTTTPSGASIYLDGKDTGKKTSAKISDLSMGEHELRLTLSGYGDIDTLVTISLGKTITLNEMLAETTHGMKFVQIPAGSFMMGSNDGYNFDENPVHMVNIKSFFVMTTEVTQAQWKAVMNNNPSRFKGDNLPVENVSWNEIKDFLKKLNKKDPNRNYRLPTEAEWEYACRAGTTAKYYSGDSESDLKRVAWYDGNSGKKTRPVGQKQPNEWGLYDMHGNVWEWCEDCYHDGYNNAPNDGSAWVSPSESYRVSRGGSWRNYPEYCRSANRNDFHLDTCGSNGGFRLVAF